MLSFVYVGIYWNNHHHLLHATQEVSGRVLWSNLHLLFWQSLVPFVTAFMGENHFTPLPTALYGFVLLMSSIAYFLLQGAIIAKQGRDSLVAGAVGRDLKGKLSMVFYSIGIALSLASAWSAVAIYVLVAAMWFVPDRRIERAVEGRRRA